MGGQFSYQKLEEKYDVNQITFDVLKLTDDGHHTYINPVVTKNCKQHLNICISLQEAQEQYISKKEINCPCGVKVKELTDLRKDIRWTTNQQFHQKTEYVQVFQGIFAHKYYRSQEYFDSLKQVNSEMPNFLLEIKNNYNGSVIEKIKQQQNFLALCLLDRVKIIIPVRIKHCKHIECYELTSLLYYSKQQKLKKNKKFFKCAYFNCNVTLNIQTLQDMASQLMLDCYLLDIFNKGQPIQINFILKQTETQIEQNKWEHDLGQLLQSSFEENSRLTIQGDIEDFEILVQNEIANVLQCKQDEQTQMMLTSTFFKNESINLEDLLTKLTVDIPVRCKKCTEITKCLDIRSFVSIYLVGKDDQNTEFECPLCYQKWDYDTPKLSEIFFVDYLLLEVMQQQDLANKQESLDLQFEGKQLFLKQMKKKKKFSRKTFLKRLKQTQKSTIAKISIFPELKFPLVLKNCQFLSVIDFDVFYDGLLEHCEKNSDWTIEEFHQNLIVDFVNQIQFHTAYQDIIKILARINLQQSQCLYDFRKRYLIFKEENSAQVLMFNNGEICVLSYQFIQDKENITCLLKNVKVKDIIIELFKNNGQIITEDLENCKDFNFYICESIYLYFLKDKIVIKLNQFKEQQQAFEQQSQSKLQNYFNEIQLIQQSLKEDDTHCLLLYNQVTDQLNFRLKVIETFISKKFEKIGGYAELQEIIEASDCLSEEQFKVTHNVKVHLGFDTLIFFATEEKLSEITDIITGISLQKNQKLKKRIIELENEMLEQEIKLKIEESTVGLFSGPSININYVSEEKIKMIIIDQESEIVNNFQTIKCLISDIKRQMFILHCSITENQQKKLQLKNEIQKIKKSLFCQIFFHEEKVKSAFYIEIKYMKKCLYFVTDSNQLSEPIMIWKISCILENQDNEYTQQKLNQQLSQIKYYFFYTQNKQNIAFDFQDWNNKGYHYEQAKKEVVEFIFDFFYKQDHYFQNVFFIENTDEEIRNSKFIVQQYFLNHDMVDFQNKSEPSVQIIEHEATQLLQKTKNANDQKELTIQSQSKQNIFLAKIELEKCLGMIEMTIKNPYLFKAEEQLFSAIISQYKKQSSNDKEITFKIYNSQLNVFQQETNCFVKHLNQYPQTWARSNSNFNKAKLNPNDAEYRMVEQHFKRSDNGNIHRIYRIENKQLWENYIFDKNKLIQSYKNLGQSLNKLEEERYLWHGVRGSHPETIYKGDREGFDQSYSDLQNNCWGIGIYFSERANVSRGYSSVLNGYQDSDLRGSKVFLYCLVTTGRIEKRASDSSIRRPNSGYDCVTDGDSIFVLYSMNVRRAYPAYEVIFN